MRLTSFTAAVAIALLSSPAYAEVSGGGLPDALHLYGYREDFSSGTGIYEITTDGNTLLWKDANYSGSFTPMSNGWIADGKLCGYALDGFGAIVWGSYYLEFDWSTGEVVSKTAGGSSYMQYATLNPNDRCIYGFGTDVSGSTAFLKAPVDNPADISTVRVIDESENCYGITYNTTDRHLAGMRGDGTLVRIDSDGSQHVLYSTGFVTSYSAEQKPNSAIAFSEADNSYYWNAQGSDYVDVLIRIDDKAGESVRIEGFEDKNFRFLLAECERTGAATPAAPVIAEFNFIDGSTDGNIVIGLPSVSETGEPISGTLEWTALTDGEKTAEGTGYAGGQATVSYNGLSEGTHVFSFSVAQGDLTSAETSRTAYIGVDTPAAPRGVTLTNSFVTWEAVTEGAHGGYLPGSISYNVYLNGEAAGTTAETSMAVDLPETGALRMVTATVTAVAGQRESDPGVSEAIKVGDAMPLPMQIAPTEEDFLLCEVINSNNDSMSWTYDASNGWFDSGFAMDCNLDDWLILPAVRLEGGSLYYVSLQARRKGSYHDAEYMEVRFGKEPTAAAMDKGAVIDVFTPDASFEYYSGTMIPEESGIWYVGIHGMSDANQYGLIVKDIRVSDEGVRPESPSAVTQLKAVAAEEGRLEATVSFLLPQETVAGERISESETISATITAESEVVLSGKPGEALSATVSTRQGVNDIAVTTACGNMPGVRATVQVFTGVTIPGIVRNVRSEVSEDMHSMTVTWDAPDGGYDGGYIDSDKLTYTILRPVETSLGTVWETVESGLTECIYEVSDEDGRLDYYEIGIAAANEAGQCVEFANTGNVLGTPHSLPIDDTFDTPTMQSLFKYDPWVTYVPDSRYNTMWGVLPKNNVPGLPQEDGNACVGQGCSDGCLGKAGFPVFSTMGVQDATFVGTFWTGDVAASEICITGDAYGVEEPVEVCAVPSNGGWNVVTAPLPDILIGRDWVRLYLNASFPDGTSQWVVMDDYSISDTTGVKTIYGNLSEIYSDSEAICIKASEGVEYSVYGIDGGIVASGAVSSETVRVSIAPGIYVVRVGRDVRKINVSQS